MALVHTQKIHLTYSYNWKLHCVHLNWFGFWNKCMNFYKPHSDESHRNFCNKFGTCGYSITAHAHECIQDLCCMDPKYTTHSVLCVLIILCLNPFFTCRQIFVFSWILKSWHAATWSVLIVEALLLGDNTVAYGGAQMYPVELNGMILYCVTDCRSWRWVWGSIRRAR